MGASPAAAPPCSTCRSPCSVCHARQLHSSASALRPDPTRPDPGSHALPPRLETRGQARGTSWVRPQGCGRSRCRPPTPAPRGLASPAGPRSDSLPKSELRQAPWSPAPPSAQMGFVAIRGSGPEGSRHSFASEQFRQKPRRGVFKPPPPLRLFHMIVTPAVAFGGVGLVGVAGVSCFPFIEVLLCCPRDCTPWEGGGTALGPALPPAPRVPPLLGAAPAGQPRPGPARDLGDARGL